MAGDVPSSARAFEALSLAQLATACGGAAPPAVIDPKKCTTGNPAGARIYTQSMETDHSGPSVSERIATSVDRQLAPWRTFNGLFGGVGGQISGIPPSLPQAR